MRRAVPMLLAGVFVLAVALPARAATVAINMQDFAFSPTPAAATLGDTVKWHNLDQLTHTATSNTGFFDLTVNAGQSKSKVFSAAGTYPYYCRFHGSPGSGMHGTLRLPDQWLNTGPQHVGDVQRIRIASVKAPNGLAYDVQMKPPGGAFGAFRTKITNAVVKFTPDAAGEYQFRSRLHRLSNGKVTGYSPAAFVEISE